MTERPIIFSASMVRALLAGTKTQTRRVVKLPPDVVRVMVDPGGTDLFGPGPYVKAYRAPDVDPPMHPRIHCPYGYPGNRLWVKETWSPVERAADAVDGVVFAADNAFVPIANTSESADRWVVAAKNDHSGRWRSPLFMPRWASRLVLEVTAIRVERVQDIGELDAVNEGMPQEVEDVTESAESAYAKAWDKINGKRAPWASNPWVWVVEFKRVLP